MVRSEKTRRIYRGDCMVRNGGFWWRFLAYIIDGILLNIIMSVWGSIMGVGFLSMAGMGLDEPSVSSGMLALTMIVSFLINWLYFAVLESSNLQGTLGKRAVGLIVTDNNGTRISFLRATGRYFAKILSSLILFIGFIMVAFTDRKRGLHDMIAGTLVYKTRDPREVNTPEGVFA
jgi:uncharacterized RDD family membrane protein YckC